MYSEQATTRVLTRHLLLLMYILLCSCRASGFTAKQFVSWRGHLHRHSHAASSVTMSKINTERQQQQKNKQHDDDDESTKKLPIVVVLAGPTAVGKSAVAARLCAQHCGLVVSADSVQAYRGGSIGSNKPTAAERQATPHLLIDVADADATYNAAEWTQDAIYCIQNLTRQKREPSQAETSNPSQNDDDNNDDVATQERWRFLREEIVKARMITGKTADEPILPVVVGGTMMYLQWLVHGRPDAMRPTETAFHKAADAIKRYQDASDWSGAVQHVSALGDKFGQQIEKLAGRDWYRIRRILEVAYTVQEKGGNESLIDGLYTGQRHDKLAYFGFDVRCFFLCPTDRMVHSKVVDQRCEQMVQRGLLEETTDLACTGQLPDMATRAIGYHQVLDYLESTNVKYQDEGALVNFLEEFSTATRRYSKRQMQWFRRDKDFVFVPIALESDNKDACVESAAKEIGRLLTVSRKEFDQERNHPEGISEQTRQANEAQGKKMKTYQFVRYTLTDGSQAFQGILDRADACRQRFQSKRTKREATTTD